MNSYVNDLRRLPFFGIWLFKAYYQARGRARYNDPKVRIAIEIATSQAMVLQIGSNDGATGDPISDLMKLNPQWRGVFVEPVPYLFARLVANYGKADRFRFENCVIGPDGDCPFYVVDELAGTELRDLPSYWNQLNSFNKEHILNSPLGKALEPYIRVLKLPSLSLNTLLQKHAINQIDVLHIDTEGADWLILQQLDLFKVMPRVILFEHKCLSEVDRNSAVSFLEERYDIENLGADFFCCLKRNYRNSTLR